MCFDMSVAMLIASFGNRNGSTRTVFDGIIQIYSSPSQGVEHRVISPHLGPPQMVAAELKTRLMKANFGTGQAACAVTVHICSISLLL
jgi:hypothetical protein